MERSGKGPALSLCPYTLKISGPLDRMLDAWIWGTLTLTFGLLSSLQGVSFNEVSETSMTFGGPKGAEACLGTQSSTCQELPKPQAIGNFLSVVFG